MKIIEGNSYYIESTTGVTFLVVADSFEESLQIFKARYGDMYKVRKITDYYKVILKATKVYEAN